MTCKNSSDHQGSPYTAEMSQRKKSMAVFADIQKKIVYGKATEEQIADEVSQK
jgi:hypothetical protein